MSPRLASPLLAIVLGLVACDAGNPEVRPGRNNLVFGTTQCDPAAATCADTPRVDRYIGSPFFHHDFRTWELQGNSDGLSSFDLTSFSLANTPFVQYGSDTAFWTTLVGGGSTVPTTQDYWNQHEVVLFARDPVEMTNHFRDYVVADFTLNGLDPSITNPVDSDKVKAELAQLFGPGTSDSPGIWRLEWHNCQVPAGSTFGCGGPSSMPNAASMFYPPQAGWTTTDLSVPQVSVPVVANVTPASFWPTGVTPTGPGSLPHPENVGSIKAAKVINHGICSSFSPYCSGPPDASGAPTCCNGGPDQDGDLLCPNNTPATGLFEKLAASIPLTLAKGLDSGNNIERRWVDIAPFLNFTQEEEDAQLGGFFLGFNVQGNVIAGGGPNVFYYDSHTWKLFDGRLTAGGEVIYSFGDGAAADCLRYSSDSLLTREIDSPTAAANDVVGRTGANPSTLAEAVFQGADKKQVYVGKLNVADTCDGHADLGISGAPPGDYECGKFWTSLQNDLDDALSVLSAPLGITVTQAAQIKATMNATDFAGSYKNLRCAQFSNDVHASCQYVMRAKRLNVYPDGVELVFIDDPHDFSNPSYPIWLILLANKLENPNSALDLYGALCGQPHAQTPGALGARSFNMEAVDYARYSCNAATSSDGDGCPYLTSTGHTSHTCTDLTITTTP